MNFRSINCPGHILAALFGAAFAATAGASAAAPENWQTLISNNPFGGAAAPTAAPANGLEFRGVVQEDGVYLINLYDPATKTAQWLPVKGSAPGLMVDRYDEQDGKVTVTQGGKQMEIAMKQPTVALSSAPMPVPQNALPQPGRPAGPGFQRGGNGPQFNRTLPPETQAMIEEIRRRRAQRQQAMQQGGAAGQSNSNPPQERESRRLNSQNSRPNPR